MASPKMFEVSFVENYAVLSMKNGENRLNVEVLKELNSALDEVERYLLTVLLIEGTTQNCQNSYRTPIHN